LDKDLKRRECPSVLKVDEMHKLPDKRLQ